MKVVILAGGLGTRISEETYLKPKPMIEIGGKPILWHIMKIYSHHGINDFIICCGYKGYLIKEYFANYSLHLSDITFDIQNNRVEVHQKFAEPWRVTLVDTGEETMTGGRLKRVASYLDEGEDFCLTYGDGVSNVDISSLIKFHFSHGLKATLTAIYAPSRFGVLDILPNHTIKSFKEKPQDMRDKINGGFFVLSPSVMDLIEGDQTVFEREPLEILAKQGQLKAFSHDGFWQPMDTLRDKNSLESLWHSGTAPWSTWKNQ
jgi:glucose-1-phosphate cytidylyltransferase